jgi:hypothetical protein
MQFIKFYHSDKQFVKMINSIGNGFELVVSDVVLKELLEKISKCEENNEKIYIVWQMKFKKTNFILYKNCVFSTPINNSYKTRDGILKESKKIKVTYSSRDFYSESLNTNMFVKKTKEKYKDPLLLRRMLKINEIEKL